MSIQVYKDFSILKSKYYQKIITLENQVFGKNLSEIYTIDRNISFNLFIKNDLFLGYIAYKLVDDNIEIYNLATNVNSTNKGIMTKLLTSLTDYNLYLEVSAANIAARNLYEKMGFKCYSTVDNYYGSEKCLKMERLKNDK